MNLLYQLLRDMHECMNLKTNNTLNYIQRLGAWLSLNVKSYIIGQCTHACVFSSHMHITMITLIMHYYVSLQKPPLCWGFTKPVKTLSVFYRGFVKHPHICRKNVQSVPMYVCTKPPLFGDIVKPLGLCKASSM